MDLPFIAIMTADNQKDIYQYLEKNKYLVLENLDKTKLRSYITSFSRK